MTKKREMYDKTRQERAKLLGFDEENERTDVQVIEVEHIKESKEI